MTDESATEQPPQGAQAPAAANHDEVVPPVSRGATVTRLVVATAAVLAVLLLGAAIGMLVGLPGTKPAAAVAAASVDVGFAQDMSTHHRQAVQMASWLRDHTTDPEIKQIAFDLESAQSDQIGRMEGWLTLWGQPELPPGNTHMAWMGGGSDSSMAMPMTMPMTTGGVAHMPGMATPEELAKLRALAGTPLDVYFLQLMIRHHRGGAPMAQYAAAHATEPAVRNLADNMVKWQSSELATMINLLTARGGTELPPN